MIDFENELFPKYWLTLTLHICKYGPKRRLAWPGNPPGRAICRDAVGTGKNGEYVSESLRGASHPIASDRATLES